MKIDRLVGIIMLLLQRDKITAPELAERFEVSRRTINRDIEDICMAGIPLITTQGRDGGVSIAEGYRVNKAVFTQEELQAILTGLKGVDSVSPAPQVAKVRAKLSTRENRAVEDQVLMIDLASHYYGSLSEKIQQIKEAALACRLISFQYYYEKGEVRRQIEPYRVVFRWSSWYVWGFCLDRDDFRLFKLNRLWDLTVMNVTFIPRAIPEGEPSFDDYFQQGEQYHFKALFQTSEKYRLIEEYGVGCFRSKKGKLLFEENFASYSNMLQWALSFGDKVEILEPEELIKDRVRQAKSSLEQKKTRKPKNKKET